MLRARLHCAQRLHDPLVLDVVAHPIRHAPEEDSSGSFLFFNGAQFILVEAQVLEATGIGGGKLINGSLGIADGNFTIRHFPATFMLAALDGVGGKSWQAMPKASPLNAADPLTIF